MGRKGKHALITSSGPSERNWQENGSDLTRLCASCGEELFDSDRFCDRCGTAQSTRYPQPESYLQPYELVPEIELEHLTKLCESCREELLDPDRFCDRCGAAQPTRYPPEPTRSVPRAAMESLSASLAAKISDLEAKLAQSVPRQEVDALHVKLRQLDSLLAVSIPRREAKAEADSLRAEIAQLQERLAGSAPKAELEAKVKELENARETIEDLGRKLLRCSGTVEDLQSKLSDSVPRTELEAIKRELQSRIVDLEAKLSSSITGREAEEPGIGTPLASRIAQLTSHGASASKCPYCAYRNQPDAIYCGSCGHKLKDQKRD